MTRSRLRWIIAIIGALGLVIVACEAPPTTQGDSGGPETVRIQQHGECTIFTHDTAQGASIAVWCNK